MKLSRMASFLLLFVLPLSMMGCLSRQMARDGSAFRRGLVEMYTDQAIDNLIRAHNNLTFVQLRYWDLLNDDTDTYTGSAKLNETLTQTTPFAVAALASYTRDLVNFWSLGTTAERKRIMSFFAEPVTTQNDIYEAYLAFAQNAEFFCKSSERPADCEAHIVRKHCDHYYWVPVQAGPSFQALVLRTSVMREAEKGIESYYERTIIAVENVQKLKDEGFKAEIVFAKGKEIPNGNGTMVVPLENGRRVQVRVLTNPAEKEGAPVSRLQIQVLKGVLLTVDNLHGAKARIYSDFYPPEAPTVPVDLDPVLRGLERIRQADSLRPLP